MIFNAKTYEITMSQYDFGIPIIFEAGAEQGFSINDEIVFLFDTPKLANKTYQVDKEDYSLPFYFTKAEANIIFDRSVKGFRHIKYSVKRYAKGQYLETIIDSTLHIENTLELELDVDPDDFYGEPKGNIDIMENGIHKVKPYATVTVKVPLPSGSAPDITANGEYNIADYETVNVNVEKDIPVDDDSLTPIEFGYDSGGFYISDTSGTGNKYAWGRDDTGIYVEEATDE